MPLFFFLSGLFFCKSLNKYGGKGLIFTKLDTIIYPYIIWSLLQGSIEVTLSNFTNGNVSWGYVFKLLWAPRAHFWFLYALFFVFLAAVAIYSTRAKKHTEVIFTLSVILYLLPPVLPSLCFDMLTRNDRGTATAQVRTLSTKLILSDYSLNTLL